MARRIATFPSASDDRPAEKRACLLSVPGLNHCRPGESAEQRDVPHRLMGLARPGRDETRIVECVHDLRALARLVVDLLVRAGREKGGERVDDREQPVPGQPRRRRDHVLLGDPALDEPVRIGELEASHAAVGREIGVEDDQILALCPESDQLVAVRVDHVLVGHRRARSTRTGLRLALERCRVGVVDTIHRLERQRRETQRGEALADPLDELRDGPLERCVVGRARVPAIRASALPERSGVLHEGHALALDRARNQCLRAVVVRAEGSERRTQRREVVSVAGSDVPAKGAEPAPRASPSETISSVGLSDWSSFRSTMTVSPARRSCAAAWSPS